MFWQRNETQNITLWSAILLNLDQHDHVMTYDVIQIPMALARWPLLGIMGMGYLRNNLVTAK